MVHYGAHGLPAVAAPYGVGATRAMVRYGAQGPPAVAALYGVGTTLVVARYDYLPSWTRAPISRLVIP